MKVPLSGIQLASGRCFLGYERMFGTCVGCAGRGTGATGLCGQLVKAGGCTPAATRVKKHLCWKSVSAARYLEWKNGAYPPREKQYRFIIAPVAVEVIDVSARTPVDARQLAIREWHKRHHIPQMESI